MRELVLQLSRGELAGVPSPHVVRLSSMGDVFVEGPVGAGRDPIARAAQLLDALLPSSAESGPQFRVPGGLRLLIGRALGTLDLPPFSSLREFAEALGRFAATDASATVAGLVITWTEIVASRTPGVDAEPLAAPTPAQIQPFVPLRTRDARPVDTADVLTVSDIRRARRATGVRLDVIAERSRIPLPLLRQLEWGYLLNWPTGPAGRAELVQYAKAAGLDEQLVVSTVVPLIEEIEQRQLAVLPHKPPPVLQHVDASPIEIEVAQVSRPSVWDDAQRRASRRRALAIGALAVPAMLAIMIVPLWQAPSPESSEPLSAPRASAPAVAAGPAAGETARVSSAGLATPDRPRASAPKLEPTRAAYRVTAEDETYSPSFASAGTAMFYQADQGGSTAFRRADTGSGGTILKVTRIVDDRANNYHVRPSPDGRRIAFDSDRDGVRGVYIADADGQHVRRVSPEGYAAVPSWSPDGSTLAFIRAEPRHPKVWNLWTLNLDTGELRQITRRTSGQPWGGSWFPDGQRIAYSHEDRLILHDLQTGTERIFPTPKKGHLVRTPAVSPDGRRIMFQVHRDGAWMLELGDGSMRRILEDPTAEEYTWAPDGRRVAFHSRKSGEWVVWVMAPR